MLILERLPFDEVDWATLDTFQDRHLFQRRHWLAFIEAFTGGKSIVAALHEQGRVVGYFSGVLFRKFGVPILGSPFRGWMTAYLGFNLDPSVPRAEALRSLETFAFRDLGAWHLEVTDRHLTQDEGVELGFIPRTIHCYFTDLTQSEDQLLGNMSSACRRALRKSSKEGVIVERANTEDFAVDYYQQLKDVYAKQNMTPTYGVDRVKKLIEFVHPSGDLLLARARNKEGLCIATGIYPSFGRMSYFWGNGSLRRHQNVRPNEALHWFAMRYWRSKGAAEHDWGGAATYKAKYGIRASTVPAFRKSRSKSILYARDLAERAYYFPRKLKRRRYTEKIGVPDIVKPGAVR